MADCFEGVGQVEGLVGDGGEVLGGEVQGVADDDGGGDYESSGEIGMGGESDGMEGISGGENCVGNGGGCDDTILGGNNNLNGRRGGSGGRGSSGGSSGGTRASNSSGGVRSDVAADCRGAGNRGGGTLCAFQTPISCAGCGNDGEESGWSFENIMGMMMAKQSGDREAREM